MSSRTPRGRGASWRRSLLPAAVLALAALFAACSEEGVVAAYPRLELPAEAYDFGDVPVLNARTLAVELRNGGRAALTIDSAALGAPAGPFAVVEAPASVEGAGQAAVIVSFLPPALGAFSATLVVLSDDDERPEARIALTGRGSTAARMEVDAAVDFPRTCEGAEALGRLTIRSTGTANLVLERIGFAEGSAGELRFATSTRTPVIVPMGGEVRLAIRYAPGAFAPEVSRGAVVLEGTDPDRRRVEIPVEGRVNRAPVAAIRASGVLAPGSLIALDGTGSKDPDGDLPLGFAWSVRASPIGSSSSVFPRDGEVASLLLDLPGAYQVQLVARDAAGCLSPPALEELVARPAQHLLVELVWNNRDADLDLHLAPAGEEFFGPADCYFAQGHQRPDWGAPGDLADDPELIRDALTGWGPEIIAYPRPAPGSYRAMVHYYNDHRSKTPATDATLRVYQFGVVRSETTRRLTFEGQRWTVLSIDWPSGVVTPIDQVR